MSDDETRVAAIRQRAEAATEGPWESRATAVPSLTLPLLIQSHSQRCNVAEGYAGGESNAEFIAHARSDIPWLLDRLRAAEARGDRLEGLLDGSHSREVEHLNRALAAEARAAEAEAVIAEAVLIASDGVNSQTWRKVVQDMTTVLTKDGLGSLQSPVLARVKAEAWDECRQAAFDINSGNDWLDDQLNANNPYRAGAEQ